MATICEPESSTLASTILLLMSTSTSQSSKEYSASGNVDGGGGDVYSSKAPVSTHHGRSRSDRDFQIDALAARTWAGVICASLPSKSHVVSLFVSC